MAASCRVGIGIDAFDQGACNCSLCFVHDAAFVWLDRRMQFAPRAEDVAPAADREGAVGVIGLPPDVMGSVVRQESDSVPSVDEAVAGIGVGAVEAAFVVQFGQNGGGCFDLFAMLEEQGAVLGVVVIASR